MRHLILSMVLLSSVISITTAQSSELVKGNNEFAFDFYKQIASSSEKNLFFSPYSISFALAMTYEGAEGETAKEMRKVMSFPDTKKELRNGFSGLLKRNLTDTDKSKYFFKSANSLWASASIEFKKDYFDRIKEYYAAPVEKVKFKRNKQRYKALEQINNWTEKETEGKIKDLLKKDDLTFETILVLVNAVYFKAEWKKQFKKRATMEDVFYSYSGKEKIDFMNLSSRMRFYKDKLHIALEIPYYQNKASMFILLPNEENSFNALQKMLDYKYFKKIKDNAKYTQVQLTLPKFKIENRMYLGKELQKAGMKLAFTKSADFTGMTDESDVSIDKVIHQSFINTDESGTEAAAATAVIIKRETSVPPNQVVKFNVNKPFMFFITDNATGSILFAGQYMKPE